MHCECCNTSISDESTNETNNCSCLKKVNSTNKSNLNFEKVEKHLSTAKISKDNKTKNKNKKSKKFKRKYKRPTKRTTIKKKSLNKTEIITKKDINNSNLNLSEIHKLSGVSSVSDRSFIGRLYHFDHSSKQRTVICYCSSNKKFNINDLVESFIEPGDLHQYSSFLEGFGTINYENKVFYAIFKTFTKSSEENFCRSLNDKYANGGIVKNCQGATFYLRTKMMQQKYAKLTLYPIPCDVNKDFILKMVKDGDWGTCTNVKCYGSFHHSWKNSLVEVTLKNFNKDCIPPFVLLNKKKVFISFYEQNDKLWKKYDKNVKELKKRNATNNENFTTSKTSENKLHNKVEINKKPADTFKNNNLDESKSKILSFSSSQNMSQNTSNVKFFKLSKNSKILKKKKSSYDVLQSLIKAVASLQKFPTLKKQSHSSLIQKLMEKIKEVNKVSSTNFLKTENSMKKNEANKFNKIIKNLHTSSTCNNYKSLKYYMRNTEPTMNSLNLSEKPQKVCTTESHMKNKLNSFKEYVKNNKVNENSKIDLYNSSFFKSSLSKIARQLYLDQPKEGASPMTKNKQESNFGIYKKLEAVRRRLNIPSYTLDLNSKRYKQK